MNKEQKTMLLRIIAAAILTVAAALLPTDGVLRFATFAVPYLVVGYDVLWSAIRNIFRGELFDERFLMALATLGAFALGEYPEGVAVMLFYQVGEIFGDIAVDRSRDSIAALMDIRPDHAVVLRNGEELTVPPGEVEPGETLVIRPGERVPLDGEIIEGRTAVDTAALTGESMPVDMEPGDGIISGSVNLTGVIKVRAGSSFAESTVNRILELAENASERKAHVENFIRRFAHWYTPCVVIGAVLLAVLPPLLFSQSWSVWVERALVFLVVSCPCALVVSVPLTFFCGMGGASRAGILIKGANYLEALAGADTVVFDKTGTLTQGRFKVEAIHPEDMTEAGLLDIAAAAESYSTHPVAESIIEAHGGHIDRSRIGEVTELAGRGLAAEIDGQTYYVGNGALMDSVGAKWRDCHLGGTIVHIAEKDLYLGHIVVNDVLKPDAAQAVAELRTLGIKKTVMLTGDAEKNARRVADAVGVDEVRSQLLPEQKVSELEKLLAEGRRVAYVGDGINDAPVLSRADVGIAMGAMGSDAAIESADIVLMDDKTAKLPLAIRISRRTMGIVKQNIVFSLAVKAAILVLGAIGAANMWTAVFGDVGVLIIATANATRAMLAGKK